MYLDPGGDPLIQKTPPPLPFLVLLIFLLEEEGEENFELHIFFSFFADNLTGVLKSLDSAQTVGFVYISRLCPQV